jgi:transglutaminase-like putative cysteine protease
MHFPSSSRAWVDEGLCAGLSFLGSIAIFELLDKPDASATLVALLISAAVGSGAGRWIVRSLYPERAVVVSAAVLIALIIEAGVPAAWHHLLVDPNTWHRVASSLRAPTERTLLAACVLVGLAGAAERVAFGDRDRAGSIGHPALAVLPALILVTWSAAAAPSVVSGALCGALIVLGGSLIFFGDPVVQQSNVDSVGTHRGSRRRGITAALLSPLAAFLVVVLSVSVSGAIGTRGSRSSDSSDAPTTEALVTNVVGFAAQDPNVVLFRAHSETPTYWQVAVLTRQTGGTWEVSPELGRVLAGKESASSGGDGSDASVGSHSNVTASVTIASYRGRVLPVPLGTTAVQGPWPTRSVDDAVVQQGPTALGEQYVTRGSVSVLGQEGTSAGPTHDVSSPLIGKPAPASAGSIPAEVQLMARQVAAGSDDQAEMVQRLVNWFRSGRFQYSTGAQPATPRGTAPVVAFLTRTKVGNCQTFTDAFAMMAQSLGIPVRVAVGFTSGTREPSGETVVTGADAHTWPEVFGGPNSGWESVEPTPPSNVTAIVPPNVRGVAPVPTNTPTTLPAQTPTSEASPTRPATSPAPNPVTPTAANVPPERQPARGNADEAPVLWILLACAVLGGVLFALVLWVRRKTSRGHVGPRQAVLEAWRESDRSLARIGLGCPRSRTPLDHAHRLRDAMFGLPDTEWKFAQSDRLGLEQLVSDIESLALLEREARYGDRPPGERAAITARAAAERVRRSLRYHHLGRAVRGLNLTTRSPGQGPGGTDWGAYASSGRGANHP